MVFRAVAVVILIQFALSMAIETYELTTTRGFADVHGSEKTANEPSVSKSHSCHQDENPCTGECDQGHCHIGHCQHTIVAPGVSHDSVLYESSAPSGFYSKCLLIGESRSLLRPPIA